MDDLISRAAAQTELQLSARRYTVAHEAHGEGRVVWSEDLISVSDAMDVLRKIPSAQPRREGRKIGEWIYDFGDWDFETCKCSECGNHMTMPIGERYNFCPNCGADMRGEQE